jgi:hypothetical protein
MSLHHSDDNCENLILFEFFVFSQGVSLGFVALDVHVAKSSFSSFDILDRFGVDGLRGFSCGVDQNHSFKLSRQVFLTMSFQWFFKTLSSFLHDSTPSLSTQEIKHLPPLSQNLPTQKICGGIGLNVY